MQCTVGKHGRFMVTMVGFQQGSHYGRQIFVHHDHEEPDTGVELESEPVAMRFAQDAERLETKCAAQVAKEWEREVARVAKRNRRACLKALKARARIQKQGEKLVAEMVRLARLEDAVVKSRKKVAAMAGQTVLFETGTVSEDN